MFSSRLPGSALLRPRRYRLAAVAAVAACAVAAAGCGSSSSSKTSSTSPGTTAAAPKGSGPVDVLYAGSLVALMTKQVGPAFQKATGYTLSGTSGDSKSLASKISGKIAQGDVFVSASPTVNASLQGAANGDWVSWYASFATSPVVLGYNPNSKFAADFKANKPWYQILSEPGIKVGRTDPTTDPKGKLTAQALTAAATADHAPALTQIGASTSNVFQEDQLVAQLQSGQLDAGFFYTAEAKAAGIATIPLTGQDLKATYTITVLNKAPHEAAAEAFVKYLLGSAGTTVLKGDDFDLLQPPQVTDPSAVPAGLKSTFSGS